MALQSITKQKSMEVVQCKNRSLHLINPAEVLFKLTTMPPSCQGKLLMWLAQNHSDLSALKCQLTTISSNRFYLCTLTTNWSLLSDKII